MTIRTDTTDKEVNTTCFLNHLLIVGTLCHQILGIAVQDMNVILININMVEQVTGHKRVIALRMVLGKSYILVHIKGNHVLKRNAAFLVGFH